MDKWIIVGILALLLVAHIYVRYKIVRILRKLHKNQIQVRPLRLRNNVYRNEQLERFPEFADDIHALWDYMKKSILILALLLLVAISSYVFL